MATDRSFAGHTFSYVGPIRPNRDVFGTVIEDLPQPRYCNERKLPLHKYGRGPFCQFSIARGWQQSGVYVLAGDDGALYVGECQNLDSRWNNGYARIAPRACFKNGQETNCRINNLIYQRTTAGAEFGLWFSPVEGGKPARLEVETAMKAALRPVWNR